jgi:PAS domain S-box-containing protein
LYHKDHARENVLSSLPSPIFLVDEHLRVIYANSLALQHFGRSESCMEGRRIYEILPVPVEKWNEFVHVQTLWGTSHGRSSPCGEFNAHDRCYQYRLFPLGMQEKTETGIIISDITEKKQLQDQLIQAEKLSSLGRLVSSMAHEMNNPLHGILAMAELILEERNPANITEYAQDIVGYSKHAAAVVREFACYARPASTDRELAIDLNERLVAAVKMVRHSPHFGDIQIITDFRSLPAIRMRRCEIDQVFVNLISNAVHAMAGHGCLTLSTQTNSSDVLASVTDTGGGVSKAHLTQIFEPFFTTKDPDRGSGLGLSVVYTIVSKYEGRVSVDTEEGKGSTFTVHFPRMSVCSQGAQ